MRIVLTLVIASVMIASAFAADTVATTDTRLVQAAKAGNSAAALALIQKRVDPNVAEPDGTTALHWAVRSNDLTLVDRLIKAGAKANTANRYGVTPIFLACQSASGLVIERLIAAGVSANTTGPEGETALHTCAHSGNVDAAKVLLAHGASINAGDSWRGQTPLMWAAAQKHPPMIKVLLEAGADVNARSTIIAWERQRTAEPRDKWLPPGGLTAMLFAAREGCVECVKVLASSGADINAIDPDSHTPLVLALMNGHYDVAGALITAGADVNVADSVGRTPLYAAVDDHTMPSSNRPAPKETDDTLTSMDIIKMLLDKRANVNAALRAAVPYRTKLDRGGDGVLGAGTTPLLRAAKAGDTPVIAMLLEKGANAKAATRNGVNGIMMAAGVATREEDMTGRNKTQKDAVDTIALLVKAGADVNAADTQGRTAAHGAALWGFTDVVKFLQANGAKLDVKDKRGLTALDHANGLAGGFGFGGSASVVREETAKAIKELGGVAGTPIPAPAGGRRGGDRNQDDPQDGDRN
jgi:ankyrin repeat protein